MRQQKVLLITLAVFSILGGILFGVQHKDYKWGESFTKNLNKRITAWKECVKQYTVDCSDNTISTIEECQKAEKNYIDCYQNEPSCQKWDNIISKAKRYEILREEMYECAQMCESFAEKDSFYYKDIFLVKYQFCTE
ncbi:transmembrane protein, putative (macronuclear) [Tetrahymena thermophila SB210]|uniref:Transmembrane protein, putative n=1 Tax=Tetrahymena thermophila (strain SB210) TaxID=312017 RepID=Q240K6_TETTS|nr:transmembrane protein, putative [Tetrahymena thermophila SB210]EAS02202.1 transmembrane protein, putative [Tetrahymena thermophila SB210]|eukprot:XP_001022447.1 transmembrane protein, putative [Tetrahymena thermophila SB210]